MGYYINYPGQPIKNKAADLVAKYGAKMISLSSVKDMSFVDGALVCVVQNPGFDAAAYCYSADELQEFSMTPGDNRQRTWLLMDRQLVEKLCNFHKGGSRV